MMPSFGGTTTQSTLYQPDSLHETTQRSLLNQTPRLPSPRKKFIQLDNYKQALQTLNNAIYC